MERVISKNLFNFPLKGLVDDDILSQEMEHFEKMVGDEKKMGQLPEEELTASVRTLVDSWMGPLSENPLLADRVIECDHSTLEIPTNHCGDYIVSALVHSPKSLAGNPMKPAIVYAHGGGVISGKVEPYRPFLSSLASDCGVVVFHVDYRLAPETRCPNNTLDFYHALKYISHHALELGVDPARIAMAGESGGGYIITSTMVLLATHSESHLVKLAMPSVPMISDYFFTAAPAGMTKEERDIVDMMQSVWKIIAGPDDLEDMWDNPLLFPAKASDDLLKNMPPTIMWEVEFDMFITEATRFANRLRGAGRLLEFVIFPGMKHGSGFDASLKCFNLEREAYKLATQEYLIK